MRISLRNHHEVCHVWASQSQERGHSSNMFFEGETIYSYGKHFPIARFHGNVVLFTTDSYSVSTAKHISYTRSAVYHHTVFDVPDVNGDHTINIQSYLSRIRDTWESHPRARTRKPYLVRENQKLISDMQSYCKWAGKKTPDYSGFDLGTAANLLTAKEFNARKREEAKQLKAKNKKLSAKAERLWYEGKSNEKSAKSKDGFYIPFGEIRIRLTADGTQVESSQNAYVPVKEARVLYKAIKAGKPVHGMKIGYYTVTGLNGTLRIGCHEIQRKEVDRLAAVLGW